MYKSKRKLISGVGIGITVLFIIGIMFFSAHEKPPYSYVRLSFVDGISLVFAVIFAYFLIEKGNDKRQRKEYCEWLIMKIQEQLELEWLKKPTVEKRRVILLTIRSIQNKLKLLSNLKIEINSKEIKYVQERFDEYEEFFGEHSQDMNYLTKSEDTFIRIITSVSDKLEELLNELYK